MAITSERVNIIFLIGLVILLLPACSDSDSNKKTGIVGSWDWYKTSGGIGMITETPESTGETRKIVFEENGDVTYYTNDMAILSSTYTVVDEETLMVEDHFTYIYSFPYVGELELIEDVADGFLHNYRRG